VHSLTPDEASQLIRRILDEHGELLCGEASWRCLGYRSPRAFQRAASRGELPVEVFNWRGVEVGSPEPSKWRDGWPAEAIRPDLRATKQPNLCATASRWGVAVFSANTRLGTNTPFLPAHRAIRRTTRSAFLTRASPSPRRFVCAESIVVIVGMTQWRPP
jgi:hypothetical protein